MTDLPSTPGTRIEVTAPLSRETGILASQIRKIPGFLPWDSMRTLFVKIWHRQAESDLQVIWRIPDVTCTKALLSRLVIHYKAWRPNTGFDGHDQAIQLKEKDFQTAYTLNRMSRAAELQNRD